ncbi:MAG: Flp pilus assembly complex ATPase component TadA [Candidatus Omnitrophica bacterium]|nr:Flp pilus assembly complex ATPase component TadA [Candidatus Omnitrophota bacterium]
MNVGLLERKLEMLGEILVEKKIIDEEQLNEALKAQTKYRELLGQTLVKLGHCMEEDVARAIAEIYKLPYIELEEMDIESGASQSIPANLAIKYNIIPVKIDGDTLCLACAKPLSPQIAANLQRLTNKQIAFYIGADTTIGSLLKKHYRVNSASVEEELAEETIDQSVIDILNDYISRALRQRASDIHFEPQETKVRIRFRIDGVLREIGFLPAGLAPPVISRIKILSGLNIAEKRAPQDGSFVFEYMDESIDIRVSTLPNVNGEKAVLRLLPSKRRIISLESLGIEKDTLEIFKSLIKRPHGIILITGPTGSGKSTTLYASLLLIRSAGINITTIEDPVEYRIEGITQTQVDHVNKITFPKALRHILRQDPDVIMVGEIRDKETADIALRAALTGHLVFATLHTNDASSALTRLIDMGCEPFFVSSTVCAIAAQRLVRINCEFCKEPFRPTRDELRMCGLEDIEQSRQWFHSPGCRRCQKTGYRGRTGIFELLKVDNLIQKEIIKNSSVDKIKETAVSCGMRTLRQDAFLKVERGLTSFEEALRVTVLD